MFDGDMFDAPTLPLLPPGMFIPEPLLWLEFSCCESDLMSSAPQLFPPLPLEYLFVCSFPLGYPTRRIYVMGDVLLLDLLLSAT